MLNFCSIVTAILKMEISRNFSMSGINSGHHNLPTYEKSLKFFNVEFVRYCGSHLEMVIGRNFSMSGHHYLPTYQILMISDNVEFLWRPFWKYRDIIIYPHQILIISNNVEFLPPIFYAVFWQPFWKCRIAPLMVTYHYMCMSNFMSQSLSI